MHSPESSVAKFVLDDFDNQLKNFVKSFSQKITKKFCRKKKQNHHQLLINNCVD